MAYLSEEERISLLMMRRSTKNDEVKQLFNNTRNKNSISKSTVERTIKRFEEIGSVKNCTIPGRPLLATVEEKALDVTQSFVEDQRPSIRKAAQ